jgi:hypothetical protein
LNRKKINRRGRGRRREEREREKEGGDWGIRGLGIRDFGLEIGAWDLGFCGVMNVT